MKGIVYILIFLPVYLSGQLQVDLPSQINIYINDSLFTPPVAWNDALIDEAQSGKIRYKIAGFRRDNKWVFTKIKLPQIFKLPQVIRQIILYYSLLNEEEDRELDEILVYPYFSSLNQKEAITCKYRRSGKYYFKVNSWQTIPIPAKPSPEEKEIFNQIMETSFQQVNKFGDIDEKIFKKVASQNGLPANRVKSIYQNIILWQLNK
jgi:hypothetical protein